MTTIIFATVCSFATLVLLAWLWARSPFHVAASFALFAIVDVFFPAIYWTMFGQVNNPEWLPLLSGDKVISGLAFYSIFFFLFIFCVIGVSFKFRKSSLVGQLLTQSIETRLVKSLGIIFILTLIQLGAEIIGYGGIEPWFFSKVIFTVAENIDGVILAGESFFATLPLREVFQALVGLGFYFRQQTKYARLFTYVFPALALFLAMATFLRGTVLTCIITLVFAEFLRRRADLGVPNPARKRGLGPVAMAVLAGFFSIYLYGAVRDGFRGMVGGNIDTEVALNAPIFITAGHGLLGVSHIVAEYGQSLPFLNGKTYFDMLLLPVPRTIYTEKPAWYGIDDITRGMGWPESTQSAVTMPGEAFANFGLLGLIMAIPLGLLFGQLQKAILVNRIRHLLLGPTVFFQIASVTNWMSFTGFMNAVQLLIILVIISSFIRSGGIPLFSRMRSMPLEHRYRYDHRHPLTRTISKN